MKQYQDLKDKTAISKLRSLNSNIKTANWNPLKFIHNCVEIAQLKELDQINQSGNSQKSRTNLKRKWRVCMKIEVWLSLNLKNQNNLNTFLLKLKKCYRLLNKLKYRISFEESNMNTKPENQGKRIWEMETDTWKISQTLKRTIKRRWKNPF